MEKAGNQDTLLIDIFAAQFARSLTDADGSQWRLVPSRRGEPATSGKPSVLFCLTLGGGLDGECYVVLDLATAERLCAAAVKVQDVTADQPVAKKVSESAEVTPREPAGSSQELSEEHAGALLRVFAGAAAGIAAVLHEQFGVVTVAASAASERASDADFVAHLEAVSEAAAITPGGQGELASPLSLLLYFSPALHSSLVRGGPSGVVAAARPGGAAEQANLELVMDVELNVTLRFGQRQLSLREVLDLASGSVVELDRQVDEPVELMLDGKVIARGEAVVIDGNYGVRVTQVLQPLLQPGLPTVPQPPSSQASPVHP